MNDLIKPNVLKLKGHVKVELFDAITNDIVQTEEGSNFISINVHDMLKLVAKGLVGFGYPNTYIRTGFINDDGRQTTSKSDTTAIGLFKFLYLSDSDLPESQTLEQHIPGTVIGHAARYVYSGTNTQRGTINQNETYGNESKLHLVFDFASDRCNGIIKSVGFCKFPSNYGVPGGLAATDMSLIVAKLFARSYSCIQYNDGYLWGSNYTKTLYKIDPVTFQEIVTYTMATASISTFCINDNIIYYVNNNSNVYKQNLYTSVTSMTTPETGNYVYGLASDGTYLYYLAGTNRLNRMPVSNLSSVTRNTLAYTYSSFGSKNMMFFNSKLYVIIRKTTTDLPDVVNLVAYDFDSNTLNFNDTIQIANAMSISSFYSIDSNVYVTALMSCYYNGAFTSDTMLYKLNSYEANSLLSRKLLANPITKTSANTMKITYDIIFED